MLNLFFISIGVLFLILAERGGRAVLWSGLLGLSMYVFWRWYFHSGFSVIYLALLIIMIRHKSRREILLSVLVYMACASPFVLMNGFRSLYEFMFGVAGNSTYVSVAELNRSTVADSFRLIIPYLWVGLSGFVLSFLLKGRIVPLAVFYLLGFMLFLKGDRFAMYLAPLCGAGLGGLGFDYLFKGGRLKPLGYALLVSISILILHKPVIGKLPPPVASKSTYEGIRSWNSIGISDDAVIGSIWDNGFLIQYLTDRAVIADGASQFKAGARLFAEAMLQNDSYNAASILNKTTGRREVYLLFTPPDMDYKLGGLIESSGLNVGFTEKKLMKTR